MKSLSISILLLLFHALPLIAQPPPRDVGKKPEPESEIVPLMVASLDRNTPVDFAKEIYPLFKKNCLACHNSSKAKAKLNLETPKDILKGSSNGPVVKPGDGENSTLFLASAHRTDEPMPPEKNKSKAVNLTPEELALLKLWIDQGAKGEGPIVAGAPSSWGAIDADVAPVNAIGVTADSARAVCGRSNRALLFNLHSGKLEGELTDPRIDAAHQDIVQSIAVNQHGVIATGGFRSLKIWRPVDTPVERELALPGETSAVAASPDGNWIAAGDTGGQVHLWKRGEWKIHSAKLHGGPVLALCFSPDGKQLFSAGQDKKVLRRLLEKLDDRKEWAVPQAVHDLAVVGTHLAVAGAEPVIRVFPLEGEGGFELAGHTKPVRRVVRLGDDTLLSASEDGLAKVWKLSEKKELRSMNNGGAAFTGLALAPDGARLAVTGPSLRVWNPADGKQLVEIKEDAAARAALGQSDRQLAVFKKLKDHRAKQKAEAEKKKGEAEKKVEVSSKDAVLREGEFRPHQLKYDALAAQKVKLALQFKQGVVALEEAVDRARLAVEKQEAAGPKAVEASRAVLTAAEAAHPKELAALKEGLKKREAELAAQRTKAQESLKQQEAQGKAAVAQAQAELKKREASKPGVLGPLQEKVKKLEAAQNPELEKAKAELAAREKELQEAVAQARTAVSDSEKRQAEALKKARDVLTKREAELSKALAQAREQAKKAEAEKTAALQKAREAHKKREAEQAKALTDAKAALKAAESGLKSNQDQANAAQKKVDDEIKKIQTEYDKAFQAARSAVFSRESALRDARKAHGEWLAAGSAETGMTGRLEHLETRKKALEKQLAEKPIQPALPVIVGDHLLAAVGEGRWMSWHAGTGKPQGELRGVGAPVAVAGLADGLLLAGYKDKKVKLLHSVPRWEFAGEVTNFTGRISALAFSPDGWTLAAASGVTSRNGTISFWNISDLSRIGSLVDPHSDTVTGMAWGPLGELLASASTDRFVKTWRVRDASLVHAFEGHTGYVQDVAWRADGLLLASAGSDHEIKIWDFELRKQKQTLKQNSKEVTALEYLGDGDTLVSSAGDPSVSIGNQKLPGVSDFMYTVAVSPDQQWILAGGEGGELLVWNAKDRKLVHRLRPPEVAKQAAVQP